MLTLAPRARPSPGFISTAELQEGLADLGFVPGAAPPPQASIAARVLASTRGGRAAEHRGNGLACDSHVARVSSLPSQKPEDSTSATEAPASVSDSDGTDGIVLLSQEAPPAATSPSAVAAPAAEGSEAYDPESSTSAAPGTVRRTQ